MTVTFYECTSLTKIIIPDSVTHIGDEAFASCAALTDVTILGGLTDFGVGVFNDSGVSMNNRGDEIIAAAREKKVAELRRKISLQENVDANERLLLLGIPSAEEMYRGINKVYNATAYKRWIVYLSNFNIYCVREDGTGMKCLKEMKNKFWLEDGCVCFHVDTGKILGTDPYHSETHYETKIERLRLPEN